MDPPNQTKRQRNSSSSSSSSANELEVRSKQQSPLVLYIKSNSERTLSSISPFKIKKIIESTAGTPKMVKTLRNGNIIVEVSRESQSSNLLAMKSFDNIPVIVEPHKTLNSSRGILRCQELKMCTEEEIIEELRSRNVYNAKKLQITKNQQRITTNTVCLTFSTPDLPKFIHVGYLKVAVTPFIPNPLRCFRCQAFGHTKFNCRKSPICANCGEQDHCQNDEKCQKTPKCTNCGQDHPSYSAQCKVWKDEKEICSNATSHSLRPAKF